jgi:hypothetical protein
MFRTHHACFSGQTAAQIIIFMGNIAMDICASARLSKSLGAALRSGTTQSVGLAAVLSTRS